LLSKKYITNNEFVWFDTVLAVSANRPWNMIWCYYVHNYGFFQLTQYIIWLMTNSIDMTCDICCVVWLFKFNNDMGHGQHGYDCMKCCGRSHGMFGHARSLAVKQKP
jgi:hypothetical protein